MCVRVVIDYTDEKVIDYVDTMSALSLTTRTLCQSSHCLHGHGVSVVVEEADTVSASSFSTRIRCPRVVVDYVDMIMTTRTSTANLKASHYFEGTISRVCLHIQKQYFEMLKMGGYLRLKQCDRAVFDTEKCDFELCNRIFWLKRKSSQPKPLQSVHVGPRQTFLQINRDTV